MNRRFALLVVIASVWASASSAVTRQSLADLSWFVGYWSSSSDTTSMEECWLPAKGGMYIGVHRDIFPGGKVFYEYLRIEWREDGYYYVAKPSNQPEAAFKLTSITSDGNSPRAVFENPEHDYPTKITYQLLPSGALRATISGPKGDSSDTSSWVMRPAALEGDD